MKNYIINSNISFKQDFKSIYQKKISKIKRLKRKKSVEKYLFLFIYLILSYKNE